jgi:uncharacterized cofD-like protein
MSRNGEQSDESRLNCVAIGGGNGLSTLLSGLKRHVGTGIGELAAIVAVTDDGGSSGRLRDELQMPPPGDIRNCMVALSEDSLLLSRLFRFRFAGDGELGGHSFGNLFLAALSEVTGDFTEAVRLSSEILASKGRIYPATDTDVRLAARLTDGTTIRGETNIGKAGPQIERLYLEPESCHPLPDAIEAIRAADILTVGPGSLYTSLLPPLLVKGVAEAIASSPAVKVFICNLMTQPGETDGMTSRGHLQMIRDYVPQIRFDHILINNSPITPEQAARYEHEGAEQIGIHGSISGEFIDGARVVYDNLLDEGIKVRHAPGRLAKAVLSLPTT